MLSIMGTGQSTFDPPRASRPIHHMPFFIEINKQGTHYGINDTSVFFLKISDTSSSGLGPLRIFYYKLNNADPESFVEIDDSKTYTTPGGGAYRLAYGYDKNRVYYESRTLEGADPATFEIMDCGYSKDANNIYRFSDKKDNIDLETFTVIGNLHYPFAYDKNHVYFENSIVEGADPATFEMMALGYSKDAKHAYWCNVYKVIPINKADPKTFVVVENTDPWPTAFAYDKNHVYFENRIIEDANPKTFEVMGCGYSRDTNNVYRYSNKIRKADPETFTVMKTANFAYDKNYLHFVGKKLKIDYKSFEVNLDKKIYQDENYSYTFFGNKIQRTKRKK